MTLEGAQLKHQNFRENRFHSRKKSLADSGLDEGDDIAGIVDNAC